MKAEIKHIHSPDVYDLANWVPEEPDFSLLVQVMVGEVGVEGEESFDTVVCTAGWLKNIAQRDGLVEGRHHLIVNSYSWPALKQYFEARVSQAEADDWDGIADQLSRYGMWEFEDYHDNPRGPSSSDKLTLIGYWNGPYVEPGWPDVEKFVDHSWNDDERSMVHTYVRHGQLFRYYLGISKCRICGVLNGVAELTDGQFVWPEGLAHYIAEHGVRLPERFVTHVRRQTNSLENFDVEIDWWRNQA